jgi:hypothetical protein
MPLLTHLPPTHTHTSHTRYESSITSIMCRFPTQRLASIIDTHAATLESSDQDAFFITTAALQDLIKRYRFGIKGHFMSLVASMLKEFLDVESRFLTVSLEAAAIKLKQEVGSDGDQSKVVMTMVAHTQLKQKCTLVTGLLDRIFAPGRMFLEGTEKGKGAAAGGQDAQLVETLEKLAELSSAATGAVAIKARMFLVKLQVRYTHTLSRSHARARTHTHTHTHTH